MSSKCKLLALLQCRQTSTAMGRHASAYAPVEGASEDRVREVVVIIVGFAFGDKYYVTLYNAGIGHTA